MAPNIGIADASIIAVLGYVVVFFGIILLMVVIMVIGKVFIAKENKKKLTACTDIPPAVAEAPKHTAPGTAGNFKLYNVPPKTAAMLMAIVANKLGKPLNELRFLSIKEVE